MKKDTFLTKPIRRGRTRKERLAILKKLFAEVDRDPQLKADIERFIYNTTH